MVQTKAHGAEIKVETKEGEIAEFIIQLPAFCYPLTNLFYGVILNIHATEINVVQSQK